MEYIEIVLNYHYWDNSVREYLYALAIFLAIFLALYLFKSVILLRLEKWALKTKTDIDDALVQVLDNAPHLLYGYLGIYVALRSLRVHEWVTKASDALLIILIVYWATHVSSQLIEYLINKTQKKSDKNEEKTNTYFALSIMAKLTIWSIGLLLILSNIGVDISALVASLGIGGIAVALAAQNILGDIFSSFSIYFDKPFEVGDFIIVGEHMGVVKKIGIKSTRIQALQGEEIVISNKELTTTRVNNYKKLKKRRVPFTFGVTYDTPTKKLEAIPEKIKTIIEEIELADFDRAHFKQFGESSLIFEVVYYVKSQEYNDYMDTQQQINLAIKQTLEKEKVDMAFPTRTIHLVK